jgi:hypothetical protein
MHEHLWGKDYLDALAAARKKLNSIPAGTPYFCFKDMDENKPSGSIRIRVETIDYFLRRYRDEVIRKRKAKEEIEAQLADLEAELRGSMASPAILREPEVQEMAAD